MTIALSKSRALMGCASSLTLMAAMFASQQVAAHGYMSEPPSRAYACRINLNTDCGAATYEPQSVGEGPKGFPALGPVDGKLASGGLAQFGTIDAQSATRWHQREITDRNIKFSWYYTAAHKTTKWEYFITKAGWNPNQPLGRDSFDTAPFCSVDGAGAVPISGAEGGTGPGAQTHDCVIPSDRVGPHIILGAWTIDNTGAAFYNVVDVNILAAAPGPDGYTNVGTLTANQSLLPGDSVKARAFTGSDESAEYSFSVDIDSEEAGHPDNWSLKLAETVNAANKPVRAGVRNEDGVIEPIKGANSFFAKAESGVTSYQMQTTMVPDPAAYMHVHDVAGEYVLDKGQVNVGFTLMTNKKINVEATVYNAENKPVGVTKQTIDATTAPVSVAVRSAPGAHSLKLIATSEDGRENFQDLKALNLTGEGSSHEFDAIYPDDIANYKVGTAVLQPKTDKVYVCKIAGWCSQAPAFYAPGTGSHWSDAWTEK